MKKLGQLASYMPTIVLSVLMPSSGQQQRSKSFPLLAGSNPA